MASRSNVCTTSAFSSCAVGVALNEECRSQRLTTKQIGLLKIPELSAESKFLRMTRTGLELQIVEKEQICLHHEKNTHQDIQVFCVDPWKIHKSTVKKSLRVVNDLDTAQSLGIKPVKS